MLNKNFLHRASDAHKGDFGRVLIIAGSRAMPGAAALAALGALRGGAGLTTVATAMSAVSVIAANHPAAMTLPLAEDDDGQIGAAAEEKLLSVIERSDAIAIGPGLGRSETLDSLIMRLYRQARLPMVIDADALNALADDQEWRKSEPAADRILTPHPGEMQRLGGGQPNDRDAQIAAASGWCNDQPRLTVVLKGARSVVCHGNQRYINTTGNPKMATGGSGDFLTGIIVSLLGQNLSAFSATATAVYLHGLAGDLAASALGCPSVLATDLYEFFPKACQQFDQTSDQNDSESLTLGAEARPFP